VKMEIFHSMPTSREAMAEAAECRGGLMAQEYTVVQEQTPHLRNALSEIAQLSAAEAE